MKYIVKTLMNLEIPSLPTVHLISTFQNKNSKMVGDN